MKRIYIWLFPLLFFVGCESVKKKNAAVETIVDSGMTHSANAAIDLPAVEGCYSMVIGKDSAFLQINTSGNEVNGKLMYNRFEKDDNDGTIEGTLEEDKIKAWYSFSSEGTISVREIYLKIIGDKLAEGYGGVGQKNDTAYYKYPTTLKYEATHPFVKVNCN